MSAAVPAAEAAAAPGAAAGGAGVAPPAAAASAAAAPRASEYEGPVQVRRQERGIARFAALPLLLGCAAAAATVEADGCLRVPLISGADEGWLRARCACPLPAR